MRELIETAQWKVLGWGAICVAGALTFLKLVANEAHDQKMGMEAFEKAEIEVIKKQIEMQAAMQADDDLLTVQAVPSYSKKADNNSNGQSS